MDSTSTDLQQQSQKQQQQPTQSQPQQQQQQPTAIHHMQPQYPTHQHPIPVSFAPAQNQSRPPTQYQSPPMQQYASYPSPSPYQFFQYTYAMNPPIPYVSQQQQPSNVPQHKPASTKPLLSREKRVATVVDPKTNKPVELPNQQQSPTKNNNNNNNNNSSNSTLSSTNSATTTTTTTATNNTTSANQNSTDVAQALLQAASESEKLDESRNTQQSSTENNIITINSNSSSSSSNNNNINNNNNTNNNINNSNSSSSNNPTSTSLTTSTTIATTATTTNATISNQNSTAPNQATSQAAPDVGTVSLQQSSPTTDSSSTKSTAGVAPPKTKLNDPSTKEVKENGKGPAKDTHTDISSCNDNEEVLQQSTKQKDANKTIYHGENKVPEDIVPTSDEVKVDNTAAMKIDNSAEEPSGENKQENSLDNKVPVIEEPSGDTKLLHYEPDQYHPVTNRGGKKKYSREFLRAVGETVPVPKQDGTSEKKDLFAPSWQTPARQDDFLRRQPYVGRNSAGQDKPRKIIQHSPSLNQEVELKTVSNPWKPSKEIKVDAPNDIVEIETLKKRFRSILNKLTPNNFDNLAQSVRELCINTEAKLAEVIDIVFAKALSEPGYCVLYGGMCSELKKISAGTANFGNTLLKRCQHQFQTDIYSDLNLDERKAKIDAEENPEVKKQLNDELYEDMYRCRKRGLGLIKFIGELYKIEMLNDQIMFDCVLRLLGDTSEESIECLCDLLVTVGEKLDQSKKSSTDKDKKASNRGASKANAYTSSNKSAASVVASGTRNAESIPIATLDQVFEQLHLIRKNEELPLSIRIRFKILDTCELRERDHWQSKKTKDANPKKLDEIREAHAEKLEQDKQKNASNRRPDNRRGLGHSGGSSNHLSSLGNDINNRGLHQSSSSHSIRESDGPPLSDAHRQFASTALRSIAGGGRNTPSGLGPLKPTVFRHGNAK